MPKHRNPKGIGLFVLGLLEDYQRTDDSFYLDQAVDLANWLITQQCDTNQWKHSCWGYHFDWNARAFFVSKNKPNVITSVYVAQALFAIAGTLTKTGDSGKSEIYRSFAIDVANFIVKSLYTEYEGRRFFAYIPYEQAFVHNASLWAAAWVSVVASYTDNDDYRSLALEVAHQSVTEQQEDGSWAYGARHHHQFIDGFHTGYNLEALDLIRSSLKVNKFDQAISKGFEYYKAHLLEPDGTAKYYNNNRYPLDMHSVAQAIITMIKLAGCDGDAIGDIDLISKVIQRSIVTLYLPDEERFAYQKNRYYTNKINYIRWTQAWVYYSFASYNNFIATEL